MLVANFADLHARGKDLDAFSRQWSRALEICRERGVDLVTIAGDVFHSPNVHDAHAGTSDIERAVVEPMAESDLPFVVIPGNHDASGPGQHSLACFDGMECARVIRRPMWFDAFPIDIFCLPWQWDGSAHKRLERPGINPGRRTLLLAHLAVGGMPMNNGRICEEGGRGVVSRSLIESLGFDCLNVGHFHGRSPIYNGALRQCDRGEEGNPQGFAIWDTDTNAQEWVEVSEAPRYRTARLLEGEAWPTPQGNELLHVVPDGWVPTSSETIEAEKSGVVVAPPDVERAERVVRAEISDDAANDPEALLRTYAATQNPPADGEFLEACVEELRALGV